MGAILAYAALAMSSSLPYKAEMDNAFQSFSVLHTRCWSSCQVFQSTEVNCLYISSEGYTVKVH